MQRERAAGSLAKRFVMGNETFCITKHSLRKVLSAIAMLIPMYLIPQAENTGHDSRKSLLLNEKE